MVNIKYHIDDFCLTSSISKNLIKLINNKPNAVDGISCIVNTNKNIGHWIKKLKKVNKKIDIHLHLNLIDGKPLSKKLKKIINKKNYLNNSFLSLFFLKIRPNFYIYKKEIEKEIDAQIKLFLNLYKKNAKKKYKKISIDSHQHIHMIPWIFDIILELNKKNNIKFIRTTKEPFVLSSKYNLLNLWFYKNLMKFIILNILSFINKKKISINKLKTNNLFFGIINSGHMNKDYINLIKKKNLSNKNIQILLHPNIAKKSEQKILGNNNKINYYLKKNRIKEFKFILEN